MKFLKITNTGELDIRLVALMGGTTKANDQYKIGQFGTGLKYTLAYLFRNNLQFKILSGIKNVEIHLETEVIKNETFEIICIDKNRTSITTRMGLEWNAWMILRELWCNALDEGGYSKDIIHLNDWDNIEGKENETSFYIQISSDIQAVIDKWELYFIHSKEAMWQNQDYAIYPGTGSLKIYKQGVLIRENKEKKALFNYDFKKGNINELRQFQGTESECALALFEAGETVIDYYLQNIKEEHFEGNDLDYSWYKSFGESWKKKIGTAKLIHTEAIENMKARGIEVDLADKIIVPKNVFKALTTKFEGIGALRTSQKLNEFFEIHDEALTERTKQVLAILESCDYFVSPELKFIYGVFGNKNIHAQINFDSKEVLISEQMKNKSMFEFATMLIEENEHFNTGMQDCSRNFQQHWINLYTKTLFDKHKIKL